MCVCVKRIFPFFSHLFRNKYQQLFFLDFLGSSIDDFCCCCCFFFCFFVVFFCLKQNDYKFQTMNGVIICLFVISLYYEPKMILKEYSEFLVCFTSQNITPSTEWLNDWWLLCMILVCFVFIVFILFPNSKKKKKKKKIVAKNTQIKHIM